MHPIIDTVPIEIGDWFFGIGQPAYRNNEFKGRFLSYSHKKCWIMGRGNRWMLAGPSKRCAYCGASFEELLPALQLMLEHAKLYIFDNLPKG